MKACFISSGLWASQENFKNFLKVTYRVGYKRVALNGQSSTWRPDLAGVPQGSTLGPLLFFICINDLPNEMKSNAKLVADDRSLSTIVKDKNESANVLNNYLLLISRWAYNWKMFFNPDPSKPDQEVIFSRKKQFQSHLTINLNNIQVERASYHLGIIIDEKLNFKQHVDDVISKINKAISVIKKCSHSLPRKSLITI